MSTPENSPSAPAPAAQRAFETVLQHIEGQILDGQLSVGDRLPAERDLALQLSVSRPAVREAIRTLEAQGVLASRVGSGALSGTHMISDRSQALGRLLRLQVALSQFPLDEVVVARIALERSSAQLAASPGADARQLDEMVELMETMEQVMDLDAFNTLDSHFHIAIARAGNNTLVGDLTQAVRESLRRPIMRAEHALEDWAGFRSQLCTEHRGIVEAILAGDATAAADRVEAHIRNSYAILLLDEEAGE